MLVFFHHFPIGHSSSKALVLAAKTQPHLVQTKKRLFAHVRQMFNLALEIGGVLPDNRADHPRKIALSFFLNCLKTIF